MKKETIIFNSDKKIRLDKFLSETLNDLTRSGAAHLIDDKSVSVNGEYLKASYCPKNGDVIEITLLPPKELEVNPQVIPLDVVYEDDDIIVINKPKGMVVHPACGNYEGTLVNALLFHCKGSLSGINGVIRPGIVHRIDKDTSGLIVAAKNDRAHLSLAEQIAEHTASREYLAVVIGNLKGDGTIDAPIGRNPKDRKKMAVTCQNSKRAVTHYHIAEYFKGYTLTECKLETGRTHQIRVHMSYIGHPILGDEVYGGVRRGFKTDGQMLHAFRLTLNHPVTGEKMVFNASPPKEYDAIISKLRNL